MATYRCLSCGSLYIDPQPPGMRYFHACPDVLDHDTGARTPRPNKRDENIVETFELFDGRLKPVRDQGSIGHVRMRARGLGRVKLSDDDLLTGVDLVRIDELRVAPGVAVPDVEE